MIEACSTCRGPLPIEHAANLHPDGARTCLGTCKPLYLFESGNPDWVVAHDEADARAAWCKALGEKPEDYADEDWERLPDDRTLKLWLLDGKLTDDTDRGGLEHVHRFGMQAEADVFSIGYDEGVGHFGGDGAAFVIPGEEDDLTEFLDNAEDHAHVWSKLKEAGAPVRGNVP